MQTEVDIRRGGGRRSSCDRAHPEPGALRRLEPGQPRARPGRARRASPERSWHSWRARAWCSASPARRTSTRSPEQTTDGNGRRRSSARSSRASARASSSIADRSAAGRARSSARPRCRAAAPSSAPATAAFVSVSPPRATTSSSPRSNGPPRPRPSSRPPAVKNTNPWSGPSIGRSIPALPPGTRAPRPPRVRRHLDRASRTAAFGRIATHERGDGQRHGEARGPAPLVRVRDRAQRRSGVEQVARGERRRRGRAARSTSRCRCPALTSGPRRGNVVVGRVGVPVAPSAQHPTGEGADVGRRRGEPLESAGGARRRGRARRPWP